MEWLLNLLGLERSGAVTKKLNEITKLLKKIMATTQETVAEIAALTQRLTDANQKLETINTNVVKVGTETDSLIDKIQELEDLINNGGTVSQEITDALAAATAQAQNVADATGVLESSVGSVDGKVEDKP